MVPGEALEEGVQEEHDKKMQLFDRINEETFDENILFRSRRLKVIEATSPGVEQKGIVEIAQLARADTEEEEEDNLNIELPGEDPVPVAREEEEITK